MIIYSWNINGYNTCNAYGGYDRIISDNPDYICFQEVKVSDPELLDNLFTIEYEKYYSFSKTHGRNGVFTYTKHRPLEIVTKIGFDDFDEDGRFLSLEFPEYYIINVYMPHGGRDKSRLPYKLNAYHYLDHYLEELQATRKPCIIVGDFNIACSDLDVERSKSNIDNIMFSEEERKVFSTILSRGIIDAYREANPTQKAYTWWPYAFSARERNVGWRIDYLLASKNAFIFNSIELKSDILGSDHCPIRAEFFLK